MQKTTRILFTLILAVGIVAPLSVPAISCPGSAKGGCGKKIVAPTPKKVCPKSPKKTCTGSCPASCKK